jgi:hypothetical protein
MMKTILVIIIGGFLLGGCNESSSKRYELVAVGETAYLLDTRTGQVWIKEPNYKIFWLITNNYLGHL